MPAFPVITAGTVCPVAGNPNSISAGMRIITVYINVIAAAPFPFAGYPNGIGIRRYGLPVIGFNRPFAYYIATSHFASCKYGTRC